MPGEGGTSVGRIVGYLVLEKSDWTRGIEAAKAEARSLGRESPTVHIDVDSAGAVAKISAVDAAGRKAGSKSGGIGLLLTSILAIGPAAVPLAAGATAAVAGLGASLAVAAVGILGIHDAMKSGTQLGQQYSAAFAPVVSEFGHLKQLAAQNMFAGINAGVKDARALFPTLNRDVSTLSGQMGQIAGHVAPGLVALFVSLNPLLADLGASLVKGATSFEHWAQSSGGVSKFVAYAQAELPKVEHTLVEVATAVGHIVSSLGPMGGVVLTSIGVLAEAIAAIPVPVLKVVVPAIIATTLALKGMAVAEIISGKVALLTGSLKGLAYAESITTGATVTTTGALAGLAIGVGEVVGPLAVVAATLYGVSKAMDFVSSKSSKGSFLHDVFDPHLGDILKSQGSKAQQGLDALSTAYWSVTGSSATSAQQLVDWGSKAENAKIVTTRFASSQKELDSTLADLKASLPGATGALDDNVDAVTRATEKIPGLRQQIDGLRSSELSATAVSGYMVAALAALSGNAISAEQDALHLKDAMAGLSEQTKTNGHSLDENTAKGRANKESLLDLITQANAHSAAVLAQTGSVNAATTALGDDEGALRRAATAAGLNKDEVDKLITSYAAVPSDVSTKVKANIKQAQDQNTILEDQIATLQLSAHIITITTYLKNVILPGVRGPSAGERHHASGGEVGGSGGPRADNQLIWASSKEFVVNAAAYAKNKPLIQSINAGAVPKLQTYARGGPVSAAAPGAVSATSSRRSRPWVVGGRLEFSKDAQGALTAFIRDVHLDEADFVGTTARM
jgi:hypothetical protein